MSLSGNGLAMAAKERYEPGTPIELRMLLFPEHYSILALAQVVRCERDQDVPEPAFVVALEFTRILEPDRDLIVRHLMKRQSEAIRQQRTGQT